MTGENLQRDGQNLFFLVSGEGPALFFAHGLFGTHADASGLTDLARGYTLIAPDLRGRGRSRPSRSVEHHRFEDHAADVLAILDHLSIDRVVMCGSSFGAAVAVSFALHNFDRIESLVLIASAFGAESEEMGEGDLASYGQLAERVAAEGLDAVVESEVERTGSTRPRTRWTQHDEMSLVAWLRSVPMYRPFERVADLRRVTARALVVSGDDTIHTPTLSAAYAQALPNATLETPEARDPALRAFLADTGRNAHQRS